MCTSYSLSKHLVFVHILALQLFTRSVSSLNFTNAYLNHKCLVKEGKYQPGSKFEKKFNDIIESVSTQLGDHIAISNNSVTIIFQCRYDISDSKCRYCYATAVAGLRRRCQRNKAAKIWYDQCYLYISHDKLFSSPVLLKIDYEDTFLMQNPNNVRGDATLFNEKVMDFLHKLAQKGVKPKGRHVEFYAVGEESLGANKLYGMVLCSQSVRRCDLCWEAAIKELSKCCAGKQGARVYMGITCNLRYELYPFINK